MKSKVRKRLIEVGTKILQNARNELYLSMHFLDIALSQLEYEMSVQTFFVGTDGWKLYYSPRFLMERFEYNPVLINRAYLHMILHCIFQHMYQEEDLEEELWNLSCDIAVEYIMDGFDYKAVKKLMSDYRVECYEMLGEKLKVLTAEGIYKLLKDGIYSDQEIMKLGLEFLVDDHSFWKGKKKNEDEENQEQNQQPQPEQKFMMELWKNISEKTKTNLETFSKNIGSEAGGFLKALKIEQRPRYDYRSFLRKFAVLRESMQVDEETFDYIFYTYGLSLYKNMPLIEAMESKEVKKVEEFVIGIDTSGSCSGQLVQTFLSETVSILLESESFQKKVNIHIIQCDNQIQEDAVITSLEELNQYKENFHAKGYGGTDFRPVFTYVDRLIQEGRLKDLKGMIYFTDGFGTFPDRRPKYDVAFVFIRDDYTDALVPPWAMKLVLDSELK